MEVQWKYCFFLEGGGEEKLWVNRKGNGYEITSQKTRRSEAVEANCAEVLIPSIQCSYKDPSQTIAIDHRLIIIINHSWRFTTSPQCPGVHIMDSRLQLNALQFIHYIVDTHWFSKLLYRTVLKLFKVHISIYKWIYTYTKTAYTACTCSILFVSDVNSYSKPIKTSEIVRILHCKPTGQEKDNWTKLSLC